MLAYRRLVAVAICIFSTLGLACFGTSRAEAEPTHYTFESGPTRPLALSPDKSKLAVANTPDHSIMVFSIDSSGALALQAMLPVGLEPVAVAWRSDGELWVVNHLSDSVSVVSLVGPPRVIRTLWVGDEPGDIVFAGPNGARAFVTAAHRGQNTPFGLDELATPGVGRADVWVFDASDPGAGAGGTPLTIVTLFGDKPRALATSPDGGLVYAAVFHSGNQTTCINEALVCDTSASSRASQVAEPACVIGGESLPGGLPPPHDNHESHPAPETGLIVKKNRDGLSPNAWQDELGRNWANAVRFHLPDEDVFAIDANAALPHEVKHWSGVGTTLFNMAVHPKSGKVFVSTTDAQNHVRFEGPGEYAAAYKPSSEPPSVRGHLAESRISILDDTGVVSRHLNKHIDYGAVPQPPGTKSKSIASPLGMEFSESGETLYVAAFGSQKIGVFSTSQLEQDTFKPNAVDHFELSGGGPTGVVVRGQRLYVTTRFDNSVRVLDAKTGVEQQWIALLDAEPARVREGRPFLYDAMKTSSNGEASCASCHTFGHMDHLGWDLGNPDGAKVANTNPFPVIGVSNPQFHPMKGPMTTQSLRGLAHMGPQHWRGDRQGDEVKAFGAFNEAFPGLLGRDEGELSEDEMKAFTEFALELRYPPNPYRALNNSLGPTELAGEQLYHGPVTDGVANCNGCHKLDPAKGFFGGDGSSSFEAEPQEFKVPHLRNVYEKIGMFGMANAQGGGFNGLSNFDGPFDNLGDQVRGFGFAHDGSIDTLARFLSATVFSMTATQQNQLQAFLAVFPADFAPVVGQQVTLTSTNAASAAGRIDLLVQRASTPFVSKVAGPGATECDLVASGVQSGQSVRWLRTPSGQFTPDDGGPPLSRQALEALAQTPGQEVTFLCAPPGTGTQMVLDYDGDTLWNWVETGTGVFVSNSDTGSSAFNPDSDGDGTSDSVEVSLGTDPNLPSSNPCTELGDCPGCAVTGDLTSDGTSNVQDVQCAILAALAELSAAGTTKPACLAGSASAADLNCSGEVNVIDVSVAATLALESPLPLAIDGNLDGCVDTCAVATEICGDGSCDDGESSLSCPADCAPMADPCGDGQCDAPSESPASCAADCEGKFDTTSCGTTYCNPQVGACLSNNSCSQALFCALGCGAVSAGCISQCTANVNAGALSQLQALLSCAQSAGCL